MLQMYAANSGISSGKTRTPFPRADDGVETPTPYSTMNLKPRPRDDELFSPLPSGEQHDVCRAETTTVPHGDEATCDHKEARAG